MRTTIQVAQDLTAILDLADDLIDEAVTKAADRLMPGGLAMVALAPVASPDEWAETLEAAEHRAQAADKPAPTIEDEDDWEPPLQTLLFWSEAWRSEHGYPLPAKPTLGSEANFIRWALDWAWENELHWDDFAADVRGTVTRLEELLKDGVRSKRGVPCLSCNVDLVRPSRPPREVHWCDGREGVCTWPHKFCEHDRGGLADEWKCPGCDRRYGIEDYRLAVAQSAFLNAEWLPMEDAMARTGAKRGSIQGWASKGHVRKRKDLNTGRMTYHIGDIQSRTSDEVA